MKHRQVKLQIDYDYQQLWPFVVPFDEAMAVVERIHQGLDGILIIHGETYGVSAENTVQIAIDDIIAWPYAKRGEMVEEEDE